MKWIFVIIGSVTLVSVLVRLIEIVLRWRDDAETRASVGRHRDGALDHPLATGCELLLLGAAYWQSHRDPLGWIALLAAFGIQLLRWATRVGAEPVAVARKQATSPSTRPVASMESPVAIPPSEAPDPAEEPAAVGAPLELPGAIPPSAVPEDASLAERDESAVATVQAAGAEPAAEPAMSVAPASQTWDFTTFVLLRSVWRPVPEVLLAAMRRAGQRDAALVPAPGDEGWVCIQAGGVRMEIHARREPIEGLALSPAVDHADADASERSGIEEHSAHVCLVTRSGSGVAAADVVRLHHRAHAALAEFAPVDAAYWPDSGILVAASELADMSREAADRPAPIQACVSVRRSAWEGATGREELLDTLGLHAFGLTDLEWVTESGEGDALEERLLSLAEGLFLGAWVAADGVMQYPDEGREWIVEIGESSHPPRRYVARLRRAPAGIAGRGAEDQPEQDATSSGPQ